MPKSKKSPGTTKPLIITYEESKNRDHDLLISSNRPTSVTENQGDHVSPYVWIIYGIKKRVEHILQSEIEELFRHKNRKSLREKRRGLYDFVSHIAALHPNNNKVNKLYENIDLALEDYNENRNKKTNIRNKIEEIKNSPTTPIQEINLTKQAIRSEYNQNLNSIESLIKRIVNIILTFYNHIPYTSFRKLNAKKITEAIDEKELKKFQAEDREGSKVNQNKNQIEGIIAESIEIKDIPAERAKIKSLIEIMAEVMHYPEITNEELLGLLRSEVTSGGIKLEKARDNSKETLILLLARHIYITFLTFPELKERLTENTIVELFVNRIIKGGEDGKFGWPKFKDNENIQDIQGQTILKIEELNKRAEELSYIKREQYEELESSPDVYPDVSSDEEDNPVRRNILPDLNIAEQQNLEKTKEELRETNEKLIAAYVRIKELENLIDQPLTNPRQQNITPLKPDDKNLEI